MDDYITNTRRYVELLDSQLTTGGNVSTSGNQFMKNTDGLGIA